VSTADRRRSGQATDGSGLRKRLAPFTQVSNATAQDAKLSARARGVLLLLLSLPVDWTVHQEWLVAQFPEGRTAVMSATRELRRRGHYRVERRRRPDGTFTTGVSVSDERNSTWAAEHAAACIRAGSDRPRWDLTLRVLADGRVEDEPPPVPVTEGDVSVTIDQQQETGHRSTGHRLAGHRETGHRSTDRHNQDGEKDGEADERPASASSPVGDVRARGAARQRSEDASNGEGKAEFDRIRRELAGRPKVPVRSSKTPKAPPTPARSVDQAAVVDQPVAAGEHDASPAAAAAERDGSAGPAQPVVDQPVATAGAPR
jgi:hypothetical protein